MWSRMAAPVWGEGTEGIDEPSKLFIPVPVLFTPVRMVLSAAPTKPGPEVDEVEAVVPLSVPDKHTISQVRATLVVSGDCGLRMRVPSTMAGKTESSSGEVGMVAKASSVHSSLEDTMSSWRSKEKSFLTGLPVAVLSTVRRLTKANVAVSIGVSLALVGFDSGLD